MHVRHANPATTAWYVGEASVRSSGRPDSSWCPTWLPDADVAPPRAAHDPIPTLQGGSLHCDSATIIECAPGDEFSPAVA